MKRSFRGLFYPLIVALAALASASPTKAADPTEPERLAETLSMSENAADKRLGERWQQMVRQRQWSDNKGKYKVFARYVSHEPDLKSVKLLVFVKKGEEISYKEVSVPLARLGNNEQTLVKQIDRLRKQVEEAATGVTPADGAINPEGVAGPEGQGTNPGGPEAGLGELAVGPEGQGRMAIPSGAIPPGAAPPGFGPPGAAGQPPMMPPNAPRNRNTAYMPDAAAWRTDFNAFAANLSAAKAGEEQKWAVEFGEMNALKAAYDASYQMGHVLGQKIPGGAKFGQLMMASQMYAMASARLGEVTWQTTIAAPIEPGPDGVKHDLKLPEPLAITLAVDDGDVGDYRRFKAGERVKFIGRFYDLGGAGETPHFTLHVRFPDDQAGQLQAAQPGQGVPNNAELRSRQREH